MGSSKPLPVGSSTAMWTMSWTRKVCSMGKRCFCGCRDKRCLMEVGGHVWQTGSGNSMFGIAKYPN
eukprot:8282265-Prorocentrum_lima.AAC.1